MTSHGMRNDFSKARTRVTSAKPDEHQQQHQRPRTCPADLTNNRLTYRSQTNHRTYKHNTSADSHYNPQMTAHEARTKRLLSLTLRSRSSPMSRSRGPLTPSGGVLITESGYRVTTTPVLASGSQRTIQLVKSVTSPQHEYRMKMIKQQ